MTGFQRQHELHGRYCCGHSQLTPSFYVLYFVVQDSLATDFMIQWFVAMACPSLLTGDEQARVNGESGQQTSLL